MTKFHRFGIGALVGVVSMVVVSVASAATDTVLTAQTDQITGYFKDNVGVVIGAFVVVACLLWMFGMAARSAGAKTAKKAG